jgi:hypothetical protein
MKPQERRRGAVADAIRLLANLLVMASAIKYLFWS